MDTSDTASGNHGKAGCLQPISVRCEASVVHLMVLNGPLARHVCCLLEKLFRLFHPALVLRPWVNMLASRDAVPRFASRCTGFSRGASRRFSLTAAVACGAVYLTDERSAGQIGLQVPGSDIDDSV